VIVKTARGAHRASHAVVCVGNWLAALVGGAFAQRLKVQRLTLHWFRPTRPADYATGHFPIFLWLHGPGPEDAFYGIPMADGMASVKVATQQLTTSTTPETMDRAVSPQESLAMHAEHVQGRLRGLGTEPAHAVACAYTVAPQSRFIIDWHPAVNNTLVVSACSGHGFKHAPALGEQVALSLLQRRLSDGLAPFRLERQPAFRAGGLQSLKLRSMARGA